MLKSTSSLKNSCPKVNRCSYRQGLRVGPKSQGPGPCRVVDLWHAPGAQGMFFFLFFFGGLQAVDFEMSEVLDGEFLARFFSFNVQLSWTDKTKT